jgi:hypothetical protein
MVTLSDPAEKRPTEVGRFCGYKKKEEDYFLPAGVAGAAGAGVS